MKSTRNRTLNRALETLKWLANLGETSREIAEFNWKNVAFLGNENAIGQLTDDVLNKQTLSLRNEIRKLWRGGETSNDIAWKFLLAEQTEYGTEDEILAVFSPATVKVDWDRGKLVLEYEGLSQIQKSIYELLQVSRLAKVCANPKCAAPYFIAKKIIQQYCSDDCKYEARKQHQNAYWERRGSRVRKERMRKSRRKKAG